MLRFIILCLVQIYCVNALPWNRIVGGVDSSIQKRPFQASLQYSFGSSFLHNCGASIISSRHLLTSASCHPGERILFIRVGSTNYDNGGQLLQASAFLEHPQYNNKWNYDFAIITTDKEIIFGPNAQPAKLADTDGPAAGSMATVSGWGVTDEFDLDSVPLNLQEVNLPVWSNAECKKVYSFITNQHICIGGTPQGSASASASACFGDSEGPATYNGVQIAVFTDSDSCTFSNIPGLYSKIAPIRQWIKQVTGV